jgi:hypothetical protein
LLKRQQDSGSTSGVFVHRQTGSFVKSRSRLGLTPRAAAAPTTALTKHRAPEKYLHGDAITMAAIPAMISTARYLGCPGLCFEHAVNGSRETHQSRSVQYQVNADGQPNEEGARGRPVPEKRKAQNDRDSP